MTNKSIEFVKSINKDISNILLFHNSPIIDENKMRIDLAPFFNNLEALNSIIKFKTHIWEYSVFLSIKNDKYKFNAFKFIMKTMMHAQYYSNNFRSIEQDYYPIIREALKNAHDAFYIEQDKEEFASRINIKMAFQDIALILEGTVLPMIRQIASQHFDTRYEFRNMPFGGVVSRLFELNDLQKILCPPPWGIRINQWRNIACHNSYKCNNKKQHVTCYYGSNNRNIIIPYKSICNVLNELLLISYTIKSALMLANADSTWATKDIFKKTDVSIDTIAATFCEAVSSQGLLIQKFNFDDSTWTIEAIDTLYRGTAAAKSILTDLKNIIVLADVKLQFRIQVLEDGATFSGLLTTKK